MLGCIKIIMNYIKEGGGVEKALSHPQLKHKK